MKNEREYIIYGAESYRQLFTVVVVCVDDVYFTPFFVTSDDVETVRFDCFP